MARVFGPLLEAVLACSGLVACAFARTWWQIARAGRRVPQSGGQVIVVFGAETIDGRPCAELDARLRFAASLYRAALAPLVLCSGGHPGAQSEARVMRRALVALGLPESDIMIDEEGSSTRRTISVARAHVRDRADGALLVSSPYHMYRIGREACRQRLPAQCWPAATTPIMRHAPSRRRQMLREVVATWWYAVPRRPGRPRRLPRTGDGLTAVAIRSPTGPRAGP